MFRHCFFRVLSAVPFAQAEPPSESTNTTPVFPYALVLLFTLLTLVIVCMPSRKT